MLQLLLLFTLLPLTELWLLVQLSGVFGFWTTIAVVLATGIAGAALARWQGFQALNRMQSEMQQGMLPAKALGDGALILVAGLLLITPGVLTDIFGLSLLIPPLRSLVMKGVRHWFAKNVRVQSVNVWDGTGEDTVRGNSTVVEGRVIDAHVVDESEAKAPADQQP
ncbi:FxsA family protein [Bythopirellula goksoeyrii]|nr:FxsA family protein [Bythopirellula goksoeyrii]